jgi:dipeptidyl aminopeptidase/acylaminoacyl peptidase
MHKFRFQLIPFSLILVVVLTGCIDLFALPSLSTSSDNQWLAVLITDEQSNMNLQAINLTDASAIPIGDSFDRQGAFDWHPTTQEIAYYNLSFDGVPSIKVQDISSPDSFGIDLFGVFAFPRPFWITQLAYSPDGNHMAMSAILFPDGTDLLTVDSSQIITEAAIFVADLNMGTVTAITTIGEQFPSTLTWSPDGSSLSYTAWLDANSDSNPYGESDTPTSFVYHLETQNTLNIGSDTVSPTWLDSTHVAYIGYTVDTATNTATTSIQSYNITDNTSQLLIPSDNQFLYTAVSASPNGSQLAILVTINQSNILLDESFDIEQHPFQTTPDHIFIADADGTNLRDIYSPLPTEILFLDVPVWSNDSSTLFISNANPIGIATASFPDISTVEDIPQQRIIALNINALDNPQLIYEGPITSSGVPHLLASFDAMSITK